tara:strand:+ start:2959 stop:4224 length:1266 start_codon:yes stop_codon:yes gene_type:complete
MAIGVFSTTDAGTGNSGETLVTQALKEHYKPERIKEMVYKNNPLMALMPKYESFGGENMPIPIIVSGPQRRSATFADGQANNQSTSSLKQFLLTRVRDYSFASITHEAIRASQGNADAFVRYATMEIDGAIHSLKRSMAVSMYRDGSGSIGIQKAGVDPQGAKLVTLATPEDISNFEVGMKIVLAETATGALLSNVGTKEIDSVDRSAGTFTVKVNFHNDADAGDHIFQLGDAHAGASFKKMRGLDAWLPSSAPTAGDSFFSVDRSTDATRLSGSRFDGSSLPIEEALIEGLSLAARNGGTPSHVFMHFKNYSQLEKALGSKVQYNKVSSSDAEVGFTSLAIHGPAGTVDVIPDVNCPADVAYGLQLDTWSLNSLGSAPQILDLDGSNMLRESTADAYEVRCGFYGNMACTAPGWNVRIAL